MLPRKQNVPAEPAANPFAISRPARLSVSDEITRVKPGVPPSLPPPPPPRSSVKPTVIPPARAESSRRSGPPSMRPPPLPKHVGSRLPPPPLPRELPRASFVPPSFADFDRAETSTNETESPRPSARALAASSNRRARPRVDEVASDMIVEPMAITHHPPAGASARPSASWAMALLALGVFGGVVTAIIAGGETDTILRAGARFIDPDAARSRAAAVAPQAEAPRPTAFMAPPAVVEHAVPAPALVPVAEKEPAREIAPVKAEVKAEPTAIVGEPLRIDANPAAKREPAKVEVAKAEVKETREAPKPRWVPPPRRPAPVAEAKPAKADKADDDAPPKRKPDLSSAAAANALAKAQLEGTL